MNEEKHIAQLLDRFLNGTTTLDDEARLADYFRTHQVPDEWAAYQDMFAMFDRGEVEVEEMKEERSKIKDERSEIKDEVIRRKPISMRLSLNAHLKLWRVAGIAAVLALLLMLLKPTTSRIAPPQRGEGGGLKVVNGPLLAKADSARTQREDSAKAHKGIPDKVVREIEDIKYNTPRHLLAREEKAPYHPPVGDVGKKKREAQKPQPPQHDDDLPTTGVTRPDPPSLNDDQELLQMRALAEAYSRMSVEEYLAVMAKQKEEEVKAIRQRGKKLEQSMMMANSPGMY